MKVATRRNRNNETYGKRESLEAGGGADYPTEA